jgi:hypothetical protein
MHGGQWGGMKNGNLWSLLGTAAAAWLSCATLAAASPGAETWNFNSIESIGGHKVTVMGTPKVVQTEHGDAMAFDGDGDRLLVEGSPIGDATAFTAEVVFNPRSTGSATDAPRFLHIEDPSDAQHTRLMMELRFNAKGEWAYDGGMTTDIGYLVLFDAALSHPGNEWARVAVSYDGATMKTFVNGKQELQGKIAFKNKVVSASAVASVAARMTKQYWLLGMIKTVRVTHAALEPKDFLTLDGTSDVRLPAEPMGGPQPGPRSPHICFPGERFLPPLVESVEAYGPDGKSGKTRIFGQSVPLLLRFSPK